tara:strand:- start:61 stop:804 length:744 start_codon:yes stop_codon:yes gene_type:complete
MTKSEFKLLMKAAESVEIENAILCYDKINDNGRLVKTPMTDHSSNSNWRIGLKVRHRGQDVWMWYKVHNFGSKGLDIWFDTSYNTATGKSLRKDGERNLKWAFEDKAKLLAYDVSDMHTRKNPDGDSRLLTYDGEEWKIETEKSGWQYVYLKRTTSGWLKWDLITCGKGGKFGKIFIKFQKHSDQKYLTAAIKESHVDFNSKMIEDDKVSFKAYLEMRMGFKYKGYTVAKNIEGKLIFIAPGTEFKV